MGQRINTKQWLFFEETIFYCHWGMLACESVWVLVCVGVYVGAVNVFGCLCVYVCGEGGMYVNVRVNVGVCVCINECVCVCVCV